MIEKLEKHISLIISILIVIGTFIYMSSIGSRLDGVVNTIDKNIKKIDLKLDSLNFVNEKLKLQIDSLKLEQKILIKNYYYEYEKINNIEDYDSIVTIIRFKLEQLKSPKFD